MELIDSVDERDRIRALARSMMYGGLASGFRYPNRKLRASLNRSRLLDELQGCCVVLQCGPCVQYLTKLRLNSPPEHPEIESAYLIAFETTSENDGFCPLNEGNYRKDVPRGELLVELKSLYEHFGLALSKKDADLPDRLDAELEFMHFLTHKEAEALESGDDRSAYVQAQRDFRRNHLVHWVKELVHCAESCALEPFYQGWVELTATFVEHDASPTFGSN